MEIDLCSIECSKWRVLHWWQFAGHVFDYFSIVTNFAKKSDSSILIFHYSYCLMYICSYKGSSVQGSLSDKKLNVRNDLHLWKYLHKCNIIVITYIEWQWVVILCLYSAIITWWITIINLIFVFFCSCKNNLCKIAVILPESWCRNKNKEMVWYGNED
jgi:hypothetical protein